MSAETLEKALRFVPYARDGEFWFSCLHEPTLHPHLAELIEQVPSAYRRKLFYTTNLAKRMPADYFDWLASSGIHHINVSIESRTPAIYEKMRKGARFRIFQENWDMLMDALARTNRPTPVRYIMMAYKSNLTELPGLVHYLVEERRASQVEIRYTFDAPYIPVDFKADEFLDETEWDRLAHELKRFPSTQVSLTRPPSGAPSPDRAKAASEPDTLPPGFLPGRVMFRVSWDGSLKVVAMLATSRHDTPVEQVVLSTNIRDIADPVIFFDELQRSHLSGSKPSDNAAEAS